jgi:quinol monooxygenase YgiN
MTARFRIKPEAQAQVEQAIREFVAYVQSTEPDTLAYTALQESADALSFLHVFSFRDAAARERHSSSPGVRRFTEVLYPECVTPPVFTEYEAVASTWRT